MINLPDELQEPLEVYSSASTKDEKDVVVLSFKTSDKGFPIVIAIEKDKEIYRIMRHRIKSVHVKENRRIRHQWKEKGLLLWQNTAKIQEIEEWEEAAEELQARAAPARATLSIKRNVKEAEEGMER